MKKRVDLNKIDINISNSHFSNEDLQNITNCNEIKALILYNNKITNEGILHIKNNQWNLLKKINLNKNLISDIGCKYLTQTYCPDLRIIILGQNNLGNIGILHLSKNIWKNLQQIHLIKSKLSNNIIHHLNKFNNPKLKILDLVENNITIAQYQQLVLSQFKKIQTICIWLTIYTNQNFNKINYQQFTKTIQQKYPKMTLF